MFINQTMYYLGTGPTVRTFAVYQTELYSLTLRMEDGCYLNFIIISFDQTLLLN